MTNERIPPQVPDVERAVLGAMLIDNTCIDSVADIFGVDRPFYGEANILIYEAMLSLHRFDPVDQVTLCEELTVNGELEAAGGPANIASLAGEMATAANAVYHAGIVLEKGRRRKLIQIACDLTTEAFNESKDIDGMVDQAISEMEQV